MFFFAFYFLVIIFFTQGILDRCFFLHTLLNNWCPVFFAFSVKMVVDADCCVDLGLLGLMNSLGCEHSLGRPFYFHLRMYISRSSPYRVGS